MCFTVPKSISPLTRCPPSAFCLLASTTHPLGPSSALYTSQRISIESELFDIYAPLGSKILCSATAPRHNLSRSGGYSPDITAVGDGASAYDPKNESQIHIRNLGTSESLSSLLDFCLYSSNTLSDNDQRRPVRMVKLRRRTARHTDVAGLRCTASHFRPVVR